MIFYSFIYYKQLKKNYLMIKNKNYRPLNNTLIRLFELLFLIKTKILAEICLI